MKKQDNDASLVFISDQINTYKKKTFKEAISTDFDK